MKCGGRLVDVATERAAWRVADVELAISPELLGAVRAESFAAKSVRRVNDVDLADGVFPALELHDVVRVP